MAWWIRPIVRLVAASLLPLAVPACITAVVWALPGDPAAIICPPQVCAGTDVLAARWNLDRGPWAFFSGWVADALGGDLGRSWRVLQGLPVAELLDTAVPNTLWLVGLAGAIVAAGMVMGTLEVVGRGWDRVAATLGLAPAVVVALLGAAAVEIRYGAASFEAEAMAWRIVVGAVVLGLADGALGDALGGARAAVRAERAQRYVAVAELRGEGAVGNMLLNVLPALVGQARARFLHLLSGAVVVEVVLRVDGVGDLLWRGTLLQDFGVVLAAATTFAVLSSALLAAHAVTELATGWAIRRAPLLDPVPVVA